MKAWHYGLLYLAGLAVLVVGAVQQTSPGYMDAEYYFVTGQRLASGQGFTEPFIWNYLANPVGIPTPSHLYWMPLASLVSALGMLVSGSLSFQGGRWIFIALAALTSPLTAFLAYSLRREVKTALLSGAFAICSGFYLPRMTTTDTFPLVMILGGLVFLLLGWMGQSRQKSGVVFWLGIFGGFLAGLMHLARADGLLWLAFIWVGMAMTLLDRPTPVHDGRPTRSRGRGVRMLLLLTFALVTGYLVVMGPWMQRTYQVSGSWLSPGGSLSLWLTDYDQLFTLHPEELSPAAWWSSGLGAILTARLDALVWNLGSTLAIQGEIVLFIPMLLGGWVLRRDARVRCGAVAWLGILAAMTLAFPFSGSRGGWFHSGAALQPLLWALAPVGLDHLVDWAGRKRNWRPNRPYLVFSIALVLITALVTWIGYRRIVTGPDAAAPAWNASYRRAVEAGSLLKAQGADPEDIVLVNNAPGFFAATGFSGATIPDGDVQSVLEAARRVQATYLLLDENTVKSLRPLYQDPHNLAGLDLLAVREGLQVYRIEETQ